MNSVTVLILISILFALMAATWSGCTEGQGGRAEASAANKDGMSLTDALAARRSVRRFKADALSAEQIGQLCWSAQGVTDKQRGFRTAPSAGALYPLELYVVTADAVDHYDPGTATLSRYLEGDVRPDLQAAALGQSCVGEAPVTFVIAGVVARTARKYGERAERYMWMEAGHAGQNLLLQATAMGLGAVPVGAFSDDRVAEVLQLPGDEAPLYLIPVGTPR